jgi:hypothetical protein
VDTAARFQPGELLAALAAVSDHWSEPTASDNEVNPNYRIVSLVAGGSVRPAAAHFRFVLDAFAPVYAAWVSCVEPGGVIHPHIDAGPYRERWQVPIRPAGVMNGLQATAGVPFPVKHWEPHSVENTADHARIHLVIDRNVFVDSRPAPYQRIEEQP